MFDSISEKFTKVIRNLRGIGKISEKNISEVLEQIKLTMLDADVNIAVVKEFVANVMDRALGLEVTNTLLPEQQFIKIMHDEIVKLLGDDDKYDITKTKPLTILMAGLHGSGKTTTTVKLAYLLKSKGYNPIVVACDIYRPAAIDQLEILVQSNDLAVYLDRSTSNVCRIAKDAIKLAKKNNHDAIIFDTAGRLQIDNKLINEIKDLKKIVTPNEIFLVADSAIGQESANVAKTFNEALGLTGIILTKFDGDAKGGAAISMKFITGVPIRFVGVGEKVKDLDVFHADRMANRILGMGDVVSLVEKANQAVDAKDQKRMAEKVQKSSFDLNDFLLALQQMHKMGPMASLMKMLPGAANMNTENDDKNKMQKTKAMIESMTLKERKSPDIINSMRRIRIAKGSGCDIKDVNSMLKQFAHMQKMMKMFKGPSGMKKMQAMASQLNIGGGLG